MPVNATWWLQGTQDIRKRMHTHIAMHLFAGYPSRILVSHASKKYRGPDIVTTPCEGVERGNQKVASQTTTTVLLFKATLAKLIPNGQLHVGHSYKLMSEPQHRLEYCGGTPHLASAHGRVDRAIP